MRDRAEVAHARSAVRGRIGVHDLSPRAREGQPEAVALARAHSPLAAAARAQAAGAEKAAKAAGRLADPTLDLAIENWRPWADDFVASADLDVFAVVTQPLDLFTRGGRKAHQLDSEPTG